MQTAKKITEIQRGSAHLHPKGGVPKNTTITSSGLRLTASEVAHEEKVYSDDPCGGSPHSY